MRKLFNSSSFLITVTSKRWSDNNTHTHKKKNNTNSHQNTKWGENSSGRLGSLVAHIAKYFFTAKKWIVKSSYTFLA